MIQIQLNEINVDSVLGQIANFVIKQLAHKITSKWEMSSSEHSIGMGKSKLSFAILTNLCLRDSPPNGVQYVLSNSD